ncbi:MAG: M15 family metallopeptidase [Jatrophihabitantaceae bacterium]
MIGIRWRAVLALLVILCAGCTQAPTAPNQTSPAVASSSVSSPASSPLPTTSSASAARPTPSNSPSTVGQLPPLSASARAAGLLDIRTIVPDAIVDLRYATSNNFVGVPLYPATARCLVHESMAAGLRTAAARLRRLGDVLVFWDCYRPHSVQVRMFQIVPNPNWVARPRAYARSHEAARSVDVTLAHAATGLACAAAQRIQGHCLLDMGTGFDNFTPAAYAFATGVGARAQSNRAVLRSAMSAGGIVVYSGEWWHFDGPGALVGRPFLDVPVD